MINSLLKFNPKINFQGKIIDSHVHTGYWPSENKELTFDDLLNLANDTFEVKVKDKAQTDEVDYMLVSDLNCIDKKAKTKELEGNQKFIDSCTYKKLKPLIVCKPGSGNAKNVESLLKANPDKVCGLKFHPRELEINANDVLYEQYLQVADKHNLPCVFHSDVTGSYADPNFIYETAKKYPKVPVVLFHMSLAPEGQIKTISEKERKARGIQDVNEEKYIWDVREAWNRDGIKVVKEALKNKDANLYLEVSWVKPETVVEAIKEVGADRVIFGTDAPLGELIKPKAYIKNISDIKTAIAESFPEKEAEKIIQKVFYDNSYNLFISKNRQT